MLAPLLLCLLEATLSTSSSPQLAENTPVFLDDFSEERGLWRAYLDPGDWTIADGVLRWEKSRDSVCLANVPPARDVVIETSVRVGDSGRACFGVILRAQKDRTNLALRYYDQTDSLEMLHFERRRVVNSFNDRARVKFERQRWFRLKAAVIGDQLFGKIWLSSEAEPDWQFRTVVEELRAGGVGLLAEDSTRATFDDVRIWVDGPPIERLRKTLALEKESRERRIRETLELGVFPVPFALPQGDSPQGDALTRRVDVRLRALEGRFALAGTLRVSFGDLNEIFELKEGDFVHGRYRLSLPDPRQRTKLRLAFDSGLGKELRAESWVQPSGKWNWDDVVARCLDTLVERGTDVYGPVHSAMLMSILDVDTLVSPRDPVLYEASIRTEGRPDHGRWSPGGSNLWHDMATLRAMYHLSRTKNAPKYALAADAYLESVFRLAVKTRRSAPGREGLLIWGSHCYYHCFKDTVGGDRRDGGVHEILIHHPEWEEMFRVDPTATRRAIDQIWNWHIMDKETGASNRHDSDGTGDFAFSSGSLGLAFSFMYSVTHERPYLDKARLLSDWHWQARGRTTGLVPDSPYGKGLWNGEHTFTEVTGCYAAQLLRSYELTGDPIFRDRAVSMIKAYEKYGWDEKSRNYFAMLRVDSGQPVVEYDEKRVAPATNYTPIGYVDVWRTIMYTFEFPLVAAQAAIYAWELSGSGDDDRDAGLLDIALHWAEVIDKNPPALGRRWREEVEEALPEVKRTGGTYAENYGRAISFFVHLYRATRNAKHLRSAERLAEEAIDKLYAETEVLDPSGERQRYGIFRGHPAKPYYESNAFVGLLLWALIELSDPEEPLRGAF